MPKAVVCLSVLLHRKQAFPAQRQHIASQRVALGIVNRNELKPVRLEQFHGLYPAFRTLASIDIPVLVLWGELSHPAVQRANALLAAGIIGAVSIEIKTAAHFMIATHANEVSRLIARHAQGAQALSGPMTAAAASSV